MRRYLIFLVAVMLLASCHTAKPISETKHDTVYVNKTEYKDREIHDSIYTHDSIYIREKGDTVIVTKWHTQYVDRWRYDTISTTDTVYKSIERDVIKEVKGKSKWWGWMGLGALLSLAAFTALWWVRHRPS